MNSVVFGTLKEEFLVAFHSCILFLENICTSFYGILLGIQFQQAKWSLTILDSTRPSVFLSNQSTKYTACLSTQCTQYCLEIKKPKIASILNEEKSNNLKRQQGYNFLIIWRTSRVLKRTSRGLKKKLWELSKLEENQN